LEGATKLVTILGNIIYLNTDIMKNMRKSALSFVSMTVLSALLCIAMAGSTQDMPEGSATAAEPDDMAFLLIQIQSDVQGSLADMESDVANASQNLSGTGLEGAEAQKFLSKLLEINPNLVEAVTFSKDGKILSAECKVCEGAVGADISSQEHVAHVIKIKTPALSGEFLTVEGYNAIAVAFPVFSRGGEFLGGISATFEPDNFLKALVVPKLSGTNCSIFVMQTDGLIVYSSDSNQIGNNLLEDPLYKPFPSLLTLVKKMLVERSGYGNYDFQVTKSNKTVVTKELYWTTAGLYDREWRLAVYRIMK
jgi:polar amino acid transport system substrate-binding protein